MRFSVAHPSNVPNREMGGARRNHIRTLTATLSIAFLLALTIVRPVHACSVVSEYRVPTTLELVDRAEAIVLARVVDGGPKTDTGLKVAQLVPFALLKGPALPSDIHFERAVLSNAEFKAVASDPRNLVDANPDAFSGGCNRHIFDKGMIIVAFLQRHEGRLMPDGSAFSRSLEDVPSPESLWVKAVKLYVQIAELPKSQRRKEMRRLRGYLGMQIEDADSRLLALELHRALLDER